MRRSSMPRPATTWRICSTSRAAQRPDNCGIFVADYASGAYALGGILAALHQRHVTGKGQMVDVSMFEALVGMLLGEVNRAQFDFEMPSRPMYGPVEAKDGYVMLATASERTFQDMATAAGRRDWLTDPRFEKYADRRMNWDKFVDEFEAWSRTLTVKECVAALEKHGVPCSPYLTVTEALKDPQVEHRGSLCTIEDSAGSYKSPAPPFRFSGSPVQSGPKVADLGEHTKSVLQEAGLSEAEIKALVKMIDPRTPILVGCGQITDTTGKPSSERSNVAFCAEAAGLALADTGAAIGAAALGRKIDARRGAGILSRHQPALRLAVRPLQQSAQGGRQPAGRRAAPAPLHAFRGQHAPVPGQPLRRGDRERRDRAGAGVRRRAAALDPERAQGGPQDRPQRGSRRRARRASATTASASPTRKRATSCAPPSTSIPCWRTPSAAA